MENQEIKSEVVETETVDEKSIPFDSAAHVVVCGVTDIDNNLIVGGSKDDVGFIMKRIENDISPALFLPEMCKIINCMYIDYRGNNDYHIYACGLTHGDTGMMVEADKNLDNYRCIPITNESIKINSISALVEYNGKLIAAIENKNDINPVAICIDKETGLSNRSMSFSSNYPEYFDIQNGIFNRISQLCVIDEYLYVIGYVYNNNNQCVSFIFKVNKEFDIVKGVFIGSEENNIRLDAGIIEHLTIDYETKTVIRLVGLSIGGDENIRIMSYIDDDLVSIDNDKIEFAKMN